MTDDEDLEDIVLLAGLYWLYDTYAKPQPIVVRPPPVPLYQCNGTSCIRNDTTGTYTTANCDNKCAVGTPKYKCSGTSCVRDDIGGNYLTSNCDNICNPVWVGDCIKTVPYYEKIVRKKGEGANVQTGKVYIISNNWGIKSTDTRLYQRYWMKSDCNFGFEWNRPEGGAPAGLNTTVGLEYRPHANTWPQMLPIKVSNIISNTAEVGYRWIATPTGVWDWSGFGDIWFVKGDTYNAANMANWKARLELMVWFDWKPENFGNAGTTKLNDGFHNYGTWEKKDLHDFVGDNWQYGRNRINFFLKDADNMPPNTRQHYIKMNIRKMIDYCITQGLLTANDYMICFDQLLETYVGTGNIEINRFNIELNGKNIR